MFLLSQGFTRRLSDSNRNAALPKLQEKGLPSPKYAPAKVSSKDSVIPPAKRLASTMDPNLTSSVHREVIINKKWTDGSVSWESLLPSLASFGKVHFLLSPDLSQA